MNKRVHALVAAALVVGSVIAVGASAGSTCTREVVEGNLDGAAEFTVRDVIVYAGGMFPGNPVVVRVEGHADRSAWYSVELPGVRDIDQLRVVGSGPRVGAYFLENGVLSFYADLEGASPGPVEIFYVAGSASWTHRYELDYNRSDLALIGRVDWNAKAMFRHVDMLFVSGKLHAGPAWQANQGATTSTAQAGGGLFDFTGRVTDADTNNLAGFAVPASSDEGIYVIHRASNVDMPGSNGHGLRTCQPTSFFMRVHTSPVEVTELVVVSDAGYGALNATIAGPGTPARLVLEIVNRGDLPWMEGRADIYRGGILAGSDAVPYTPRNGSMRMEMGSALDLEAARTTAWDNGTAFHNFSVTNRDVTAYTVEVQAAVRGTVADAGPFEREGSLLKARLRVGPGERIEIGWRGLA